MPIPQLSKKIQKDWKRKKIKTSSHRVNRHTNVLAVGIKKIYQKRKKGNFKKKLFLVIITFILIGGIFSLGLFTWYTRDLPNPDRLLERAIAQSTKIYDRTGETILYEIHGEKRRTMINLEDLPEYVKWATIVVEDKDFYQHSGFDFKRIVKATLVNILQGKKAQGASTITQQFVKNAILTSEKTYTRKLKELVLSYQIEKKFTKDQILKMYFNEIPYGSNAYGIEAASQNYFGKSAKDLSLAEAAILAALPKAPTYYFNYQDELFARQRFILDLMSKEGYISQEQAETAKTEKVKFKPKRESIIAPHFVMYVKELLGQKYGERIAEQGGLRVYTTIDIEKQKIAEEILKKQAEKNKENFNASNAALVCLDTTNGEILAMVGSKDYFNDEIDGQVNVSIMPRQPGSSFKPIVYAAALEKGYTPETVIFDLKTDFAVSGEPYAPENYTGKEYGPVTMRQSLAGSLNIASVKVLYLTGLKNVLSLANKMGYTTLNEPDRYGLSLVLGGGDVKLLEHTAAFSIFAQEGVQHKTKAILKIEDNQGKTIEKEKEVHGKRVLDIQTSRKINSILSDNEARSFIFGNQSYLSLGSIPAAVKTGTTNNYRDGWTIGYTPSIVTGVWAGNNDNSEMKGKADGSNVAAPIWHDFMKEILKDKEIKEFIPPEPEEIEKPILRGKWENKKIVKIDKASRKLASELTPPTFIEDKVYKEVHDILYYVDKDNPRGPIPENPEKDPQYTGWEEAVQKWVKEKNIIPERPPTEKDDLHSIEDQPEVIITSPEDNYLLSDNFLITSAQASAPRGISRIEYYIDNQFIGSSYKPPFEIEIEIINLIKGNHILKAIAYDDIDNNKGDEIKFFYTKEENYSNEPVVFWINLKNNSSFSIDNLPINILLSVSAPFSVDKIKFYYSLENNPPFMLGMITQPEDLNNIQIKWANIQQPGNYKIYAEILGKNGKFFTTKSVSIFVTKK